MLNLSKLKQTKASTNLLNNKGDLSGNIKHNPVSTKEWFDSIYNYYNSYQKNVPSINMNVSNIIKNYFNMFSNDLEKSVMLRRKALWKRKLKLNRILVSKPEFKHTNDKVVITLYVYNRELVWLNHKMKKVKGKLFSEYFISILTNKYLTLKRIDMLKDVTKKVWDLKKSLKSIYKKSYKRGILNSSKLNNIINNWKSYKISHDIFRGKGLINVGRSLNVFEGNLNNIPQYKRLINFSSNINSIESKDIEILYKFDLNKFTYVELLKRFTNRIKLYIRLNRIIKFNLFKFTILIMPLKSFLEKVYKKEVEFNIINLKSYHFSSDLITKVMGIRLRNRKAKLSRVINLVLSKIRIPLTRRLQYSKEVSRNRVLQNILLKQYVNKHFVDKNPFINSISLNKRLLDKKTDIKLDKLSYIKSNKDKLDLILKSVYPNEYNFNLSKDIINLKNISIRNTENTVLDTIKNKTISGIRIESSGRLSKRITAARSVFKVKQIGTIRNINSSYKKIPSVLLRGNLRSNIDFSKLSGKTRIGSFGLKGWLSNV